VGWAELFIDFDRDSAANVLEKAVAAPAIASELMRSPTDEQPRKKKAALGDGLFTS
jgi:hypothetical protein